MFRRFCNLQANIAKMVNDYPVILFMKGNPDDPKCGFSRYAIDALKYYQVSNFHFIDILESDQLREEVKTFSNWPTFPQLYVEGELIGGCDIIADMHKEDTFKEVIGKYSASAEQTTEQE